MRRRLDERVPGAAGPSVRAEDHEVVRQSGKAYALVRADAVLGVERRQVEAVAAPAPVLAVVLGVGGEPEAGRQDQRVDRALPAVGREYAARRDPLDRRADQL